MSKKWSPLQEAIFAYCANEPGSAIVEAVAGSGKSTTIVEASKRVKGTHILLAFNKVIAEELKARGVNARTFHSLTYGPVLTATGATRAEPDKLRKLCDQHMTGNDSWLYGTFACRLVGLAKQQGIGCLVDDVENEWLKICAHHDLEPDKENADFGRGVELARKLLEWSNASKLVDFDDMLYMAVREGISLPKFDVVFVDEAQDTNAIQRALLRKLLKPRGRVIAVGDPAQAIYGFRGADSDSMELIAQEFDCAKLPLSITYRCPTSVVTYARQWVDHIQAAEGAPEGVVKTLGTKWKLDDMQAGDVVGCRKTLPLMELAYRFVRAHRPVTMLGREIGQGLKALVRKMNDERIDALIDKLRAWAERETEKAMAKNDAYKVEAVNDKADCILYMIDALPEDERTVANLLRRIDELFLDKTGAVILGTIHRLKGLEADRVWWLGRSECPAKWARQDWQRQQELNLCYVMATRAKHELYMIELSEVKASTGSASGDKQVALEKGTSDAL